eukprot:6212415-Pleurochrysis_carterae.AAC.3
MDADATDHCHRLRDAQQCIQTKSQQRPLRGDACSGLTRSSVIRCTSLVIWKRSVADRENRGDNPLHGRELIGEHGRGRVANTKPVRAWT